MDYRNRKYYLIEFDLRTFNMRRERLKILSPSLKMHSPYRHIKDNNTCYGYDRIKNKQIYPWFMISCRIDESIPLEYEMNKAIRNDISFRYCELTKDICKQ